MAMGSQSNQTSSDGNNATNHFAQQTGLLTRHQDN